jgi:serine protease Do
MRFRLLLLVALCCCTRGPADAAPAQPFVAPPAAAAPPVLVAAAPPATTERVTGPLPSLAPLVKELKPAVISVFTSQVPKGRRFHRGWEMDPFEEFMRRFAPEGQPEPRQGLGSGFYIGDGLVLTNNHVVEQADQIQVRADGGREWKAKVIGRDPKTDVGLLKIDGDGAKDLPAVRLGDSDDLQVGDYVVAIGQPFGLEHTVTAGIVSAKGRRIGQGPYDAFIQTDAAINPGNSGGPLFNLKGEVVGINTAIFSRAGGNIGIGFAVPINLVKELLPQLREKGKVVRGWLGVAIQDLEPDIAKAMGLDRNVTKGALIAQVFSGSPAEKAGLAEGDVVYQWNGKVVESFAELSRLVAATEPGKTVEVKYVREGKEKSTRITVTERTDEGEEAAVSGGGASGEDMLGLEVRALDRELARRYSIGADDGVVVVGVDPSGPAAAAGVREGDLVVEINKQPVPNVRAYGKAIDKIRKGQTALLRVKRGESAIYMALKP